MSQSEWPRRGVLAAAGLIASGLPLAVARAQTKARPKPHTKPKAGPAKSSVRLNVRDFDAKGDGAAKDTLALQQALDRCAMLGGGEVLVPAGTYLIGAIRIGANTILRLDDQATLMGSPDLADYPLTQVRWEGRWIKGYIGLVSALNADNIAVVGKGRIIGNPAIKSRVDPVTGVRHPALLEPVNCKGVRFEGLFTQQNDMWSIHPVYCEDISFRDMTVNGGADGIDINSCKRVVIDGCSFATSDDCISLKSGRGMEGYVIARPTEDVRITSCTFNDLHFACIGIGSETSGGIRGVVVEHCKFLGCKTFAIYIKSRAGRGAFIEDITMTDLDISGAQGGFLSITNLKSGKQDEFPVPGQAGLPLLKNLRFDNVRVHDAPELVFATAIHPDQPIDGFVLNNITGTCAKGMSLANIKNAAFSNIKVTGYAGPLIGVHNVTGKGLAGAVQIPAPPPVEPVPQPAKPYVLGDLKPN